MLFIYVPIVKAQTNTEKQLTNQLILLLTEMIKQLQQQIADILAQQISQQNISKNSSTGTSVVPLITESELPPFEFEPTINLYRPNNGTSPSVNFLIVPEITSEVIANNKLPDNCELRTIDTSKSGNQEKVTKFDGFSVKININSNEIPYTNWRILCNKEGYRTGVKFGSLGGF